MELNKYKIVQAYLHNYIHIYKRMSVYLEVNEKYQKRNQAMLEEVFKGIGYGVD